MAVDGATMNESVAHEAHLHHLVFLVSVDTNVVDEREAEIEAQVGYSAMFSIGRKAVNYAILFVVEPRAFDNVVGGIVANAKHECPNDAVGGVFDNVVSVVFDVEANVIFGRIAVNPLVRVASASHECTCAVVDGHNGRNVVDFTFSNRHHRTKIVNKTEIIMCRKFLLLTL